MTTIAWDGKTLAADRLTCAGNLRIGETTKITKSANGTLAGAAGTLTTTAGFLRWVKNGMRGKRPPLNSSEAIIIYPDGSIELHDENGYSDLQIDYIALGSGEDYAIAAMAAGHTAKEAVEVSIKLSVHTGGGIDCLTLDKPLAKKVTKQSGAGGGGTKRNTRRRG